jgi:hypothetical protein
MNALLLSHLLKDHNESMLFLSHLLDLFHKLSEKTTAVAFHLPAVFIGIAG